MSTARAITVIDDQQVRVTTWTFDGAGDATGPHVHEYDYIVVRDRREVHRRRFGRCHP
jgi:hypothetical protein